MVMSRPGRRLNTPGSSPLALGRMPRRDRCPSERCLLVPWQQPRRPVKRKEIVRPTLLLWALVDEVRLVVERRVDLTDLSAERRVDLRGGLDGLNGAALLCEQESARETLHTRDTATTPLTALGDVGAHSREFDENDVAERLLGVVGDADGRDASVRVEGRPLVVRGEAGG